MFVVVFIYLFLSNCQHGAENCWICACVVSNNHPPLQKKKLFLLTTDKNTIAVEFVISVLEATKLKVS